jgi:hypothetical protein
MKMLIGTREHDVPDTLAPAPSSQLPSTDGAPATRADAIAALDGPLKHFIGGFQRRCLLDNFRGEERQYFYDLVVQYAQRVTAMPQSYETDGQGQDAIAYLHYFAGGMANWYITEKDKGCGCPQGQHEDGCPDASGGNRQQQAFGLADLFRDGGELGYISIAEILANNGELDLHWTPKPLKEISHE